MGLFGRDIYVHVHDDLRHSTSSDAKRYALLQTPFPNICFDRSHGPEDSEDLAKRPINSYSLETFRRV